MKKEVLVHLVKAARDAMHLERTLTDIGYDGTPYLNLYGEIAEAIYSMLGEDTETFDESVTANALLGYSSDETCAEELASFCDDVRIPDSTRAVLEERARETGMTVQRMISLILSEWAMKEVIFKTMTA